MPCYFPLQAFQSETSGAVVFRQAVGFRSLQLPCGQCIGCRLERARQWAVRCMHQAQLHDSNCFLTLTIDDDHMTPGGTLVLDHVPLFMKRLRRRIDCKISSFYCGEYGEQDASMYGGRLVPLLTEHSHGLGRPHYHCLIFGYDFPDKYRLPRSADKEPLFRSPFLEELWTLGNSSIGQVTFKSAAYCAGYALKKVTGDEAPGWYQRVDLETGEVFDLVPPFARMSRRPAIGKHWYKRFSQDVLQEDSVVANGRQMKPPRYYMKLIEEEYPLMFDFMKLDRKDQARDSSDNTFERLKVRGAVKAASITSRKGEL